MIDRRTAPAPSALALALALSASTRASSLDTALIDRVVHTKIDEIQRCYDEGLARKPRLAGKVVVLFTVEKDGAVSEAVTKKGTTLKDETVVSCLLAAFRGLHFPDLAAGCDASEEDCSVKITYPLRFSPG